MNTIRVHPIHTQAEYRSAMMRIHVLAEQDPSSGTREFDELEVWSLLVRHYEDERVPREHPSIKDVVEFRADQMGLSPRDLDAIFGGSGRRSEVLSGKRALSKSMATRLRDLGVPDPLLLKLLLRDGETDQRQALSKVDIKKRTSHHPQKRPHVALRATRVLTSRIISKSITKPPQTRPVAKK